eukprot:scaffold40385_cov26-Prasinocladus_malaysianus.AAC.2
MAGLSGVLAGALEAAGASLDSEVVDYVNDMAQSVLEDADGPADEVMSDGRPQSVQCSSDANWLEAAVAPIT